MNLDMPLSAASNRCLKSPSGCDEPCAANRGRCWISKAIFRVFRPRISNENRSHGFRRTLGPPLIRFTKSSGVRFAVRIKKFLAPFLPRFLEFRRGDVPVRPTLSGDGTQVLSKLFQSRTPKEPVAHVDLIDDE